VVSVIPAAHYAAAAAAAASVAAVADARFAGSIPPSPPLDEHWTRVQAER